MVYFYRHKRLLVIKKHYICLVQKTSVIYLNAYESYLRLQENTERMHLAALDSQ